MLKRYEKFLEIFDKRIQSYFNIHKEYICCKKCCTECCEIGQYPFSRLEAEYIMSGYLALPPEIRKIIKNNINKIKQERLNFKGSEFLYRCPFLIEKECSLYNYRGIICRIFGLAYIDNGMVKLPECANSGKNYSKVYDSEKGEIILQNPIAENLRTDMVLRSQLAEEFELECGEIRPLIEWFL